MAAETNTIQQVQKRKLQTAIRDNKPIDYVKNILTKLYLQNEGSYDVGCMVLDDERRCSLVMIGVICGNISAVEYLAKCQKYDLFLVDDTNQNVFHYIASCSSSKRVATRMFDMLAGKLEALSSASVIGNIDGDMRDLDVMLQQRNHRRQTPLDLAAAFKRPSLVKRFIKKGAIMSIIPQDQEKLQQLAKEYGNIEVYQLLQESYRIDEAMRLYKQVEHEAGIIGDETNITSKTEMKRTMAQKARKIKSTLDEVIELCEGESSTSGT